MEKYDEYIDNPNGDYSLPEGSFTITRVREIATTAEERREAKAIAEADEEFGVIW